MVYFQTQNPNLDKFWTVLQWNELVFLCHWVNFTTISYVLWSFGDIFSRVGIEYQEKSVNPAGASCCV
jgi:hypothetical protein